MSSSCSSSPSRCTTRPAASRRPTRPCCAATSSVARPPGTGSAALRSAGTCVAAGRPLERAGYLQRDPHRPRVYVLTDLMGGDDTALAAEEGEPTAPVLVPLVGQIAAGVPITAEEHVEELLPVPPTLLPAAGPFFALKVCGDSMTGARILDGDTVVVRATQAADHGDIVAALVDETEATVKRLHHGGRGGSWLVPANGNYEPIPAKGALILGTVVAVLRKV
ncbi:repressor LexA [Streptacidiphilus pinicola]|uniref:Repressor LexA n=1 Tax=Streptacidiphilus pinicola TaxID=2219663 RepID=A0A2X0IN91_9ACTN|nr:transcriptional repressor LexA [Streptacidiphilus pinicola]RAG85003.1 repressor LexA [Streptacidiphilus pinicola]